MFRVHVLRLGAVPSASAVVQSRFRERRLVHTLCQKKGVGVSCFKPGRSHNENEILEPAATVPSGCLLLSTALVRGILRGVRKTKTVNTMVRCVSPLIADLGSEQLVLAAVTL